MPQGSNQGSAVSDQLNGDQVDIGYSQGHLEFSYLLQETWVDYVGNEGLLQVPVGAPVPRGQGPLPCKIVRTNAGTMRKVVNYNYVRVGVPPIIPPPEPNDDNFVLLWHQRVFSGHRELSPGVYAFTRAGQYVYAMVVPATSADVLAVGLSPAYSGSAGRVVMEPSDYDPTILD